MARVGDRQFSFDPFRDNGTPRDNQYMKKANNRLNMPGKSPYANPKGGRIYPGGRLGGRTPAHGITISRGGKRADHPGTAHRNARSGGGSSY